MSWVRVDDGLPDHHKFARAVALAGPAVGGLLLALWCHAARGDNHGRLHRGQAMQIARGIKCTRKHLDALLTVGFLEADGEWLEVHDAADYQPSATPPPSTDEKRAKKAARQARWRASRAGDVDAHVDAPDASTASTEASPVDAGVDVSRARGVDIPVPDPVPVPVYKPVDAPVDAPDETETPPPTKAAQTQASHDRYAKHYSAGISSVTGKPHTVPRQARPELAGLLADHAKGLRLDALDRWLFETAAAYATATKAKPHFEAGYSIKRFLDWLNGGRLSSTDPPAAAANGARRGPMLQPTDPDAPWMKLPEAVGE